MWIVRGFKISKKLSTLGGVILLKSLNVLKSAVTVKLDKPPRFVYFHCNWLYVNDLFHCNLLNFYNQLQWKQTNLGGLSSFTVTGYRNCSSFHAELPDT